MTKYLLLSILLIISISIFAQNIPKDFKTSSNQIKYKIFKSNSKTKIEVGDRVEMNVISKDDSGNELFNSFKLNNNRPVSTVIPQSEGDGDIFGTLLLLNEGDSAIFYIPTEPLNKRNPSNKINSTYIVQYSKIISIDKVEKNYPTSREYLDDNETNYLKDDSNKIISFNKVLFCNNENLIYQKCESFIHYKWVGKTINGFAEGNGYLAISILPYFNKINYTINEDKDNEIVLLVGEMWNGKFIGNVERQLYLYGSLIRKDSFVFINGVARKGTIRRHKLGKEQGVYIGEINGSAFSGNGVLTNEDGSYFKGKFKNNKWEGNGTGKVINDDKSWYEGELKNGVENGKGTLRMPDGKRYTGNFIDGVPNGKFKIEAWTLMGVVSNKWDAEYNMGKLVSSNQTDNSLDDFLSGSHSSSSSSSSNSNEEKYANQSSANSNQNNDVEIKIGRSRKKCCFALEESYCFDLYVNGKLKALDNTISKSKLGYWHSGCVGLLSDEFTKKDIDYKDALIIWYEKYYNKQHGTIKIENK